MAYNGYVEVEVRLLRQGHGTDSSGEPGSGYAVEQACTVRIEEEDARGFATAPAMVPGRAASTIRSAIRDMFDQDDRYELSERWKRATVDMSAEQMRRALEVLET